MYASSSRLWCYQGLTFSFFYTVPWILIFLLVSTNIYLPTNWNVWEFVKISFHEGHQIPWSQWFISNSTVYNSSIMMIYNHTWLTYIHQKMLFEVLRIYTSLLKLYLHKCHRNGYHSVNPHNNDENGCGPQIKLVSNVIAHIRIYTNDKHNFSTIFFFNWKLSVTLIKKIARCTYEYNRHGFWGQTICHSSFHKYI